MTSWIVAIANTHPQHWDIAARHGFWDMTRHADIRSGDTVYFWVTKGSLVSKTLALSDAVPLTEADSPPWEDSGVRTYTARFHLRVLSDQPNSQPSWGTVAKATGVRAGLNFGPQRVDDPDGEAWLAAQFLDDGNAAPPVDLRLDDSLRVEVEALLGEDLRERALREIAVRQGQPAFRAALMGVYRGTCCITGYRTESVLEAAHIAPYKGLHTNEVTNGLLLRSDIHTLFDRHLLTVTPDYVIRVSPTLDDSPYEHFDGRPLPLPTAVSDRPSPSALQAHNADCNWLSTSESRLF